MAAATTDKFKKTGASTVTALAAPGKAIGASSITVGSTTNYPTTTGIIISIRVVDTNGDLVAGTYTEWRATVSSGTTFAIETTPVYGSDQVYAAGSTTQVSLRLSSYAHNELVDGILVHADQDGTLKAGAVDVTAVMADGIITEAKIADGIITEAKIADASVTNAKLSTAAGEINAASTAWTPTITAATGSFTTVSGAGKYHKIGKRIFFEANITITTVGTGQGCVFTVPVTASASGYYSCSGRDDAVSGKMLQGRLTSTTQIGLSNYDNTNPSASGAIFRVAGSYEVA